MQDLDRTYRIFTLCNDRHPMQPKTIVDIVDYQAGLLETLEGKLIKARLMFTRKRIQPNVFVLYDVELDFQLIQKLAYYHRSTLTEKQFVQLLVAESQFELLDALVTRSLSYPAGFMYPRAGRAVLHVSRLTLLKAIMMAGTMEAYLHYNGERLYSEMQFSGPSQDSRNLHRKLQAAINQTRSYALNSKWKSHGDPPFSWAIFLQDLLLFILL